MRKLDFGGMQFRVRPHARCPHQLRGSRKRRHDPGNVLMFNHWEQCPEVTRKCISELKSRAKLLKDGASYVARQFYNAVKAVGRRIRRLGGWFIEELGIVVLAVMAKSEAVQFHFLYGSAKYILNLQPEEFLFSA